VDASLSALKVVKVDEILPIKMRWLGGVETPVTTQHFLTYRNEQTIAADGAYWIVRIPRPILILRDEADGVVLPFEPYMLLSAAQAERSLVPSIKYVLVPNRRTPSTEGHQFADTTMALVDAVSAWLAEHHL
jgi:hypothetical protein